jgi:hypothetical protein
MLEKLLGYGLGFRSPGDVVSDATPGELPWVSRKSSVPAAHYRRFSWLPTPVSPAAG